MQIRPSGTGQRNTNKSFRPVAERGQRRIKKNKGAVAIEV